MIDDGSQHAENVISQNTSQQKHYVCPYVKAIVVPQQEIAIWKKEASLPSDASLQPKKLGWVSGTVPTTLEYHLALILSYLLLLL